MVAGVMTIRKTAFMLMCMLPATGMGQALNDPTRPPLEIGEGVSTSVQAASSSNTKGLLSVIISPERCAAIIDGKTIRLGEKYGSAILTEINAHGVILQDARGNRSMALFPGVGMKVTATAPQAQQGVVCRLGNQKFENQEIKNQNAGKNYPRQPVLKEKK